MHGLIAGRHTSKQCVAPTPAHRRALGRCNYIQPQQEPSSLHSHTQRVEADSARLCFPVIPTESSAASVRTFKRHKANVNLVLCRPLLHLPNLFGSRIHTCSQIQWHSPTIMHILSTKRFDTSANGANMVDGCNKARLRAERIEPSMLGNPPSSGRYLGAFRPEAAPVWGARGWNLRRMRS